MQLSCASLAERPKCNAMPLALDGFLAAPVTLSLLPIPLVAGGRTSCKHVSLLEGEGHDKLICKHFTDTKFCRLRGNRA
jgi:hypothetical protein